VTTTMERCIWAGSDPLMVAYHDEEWGVPCFDDDELFERLMLEGFQAGLSWSTILNKRDNFRRAFHNWDARTIAAYGDEDIARLLADPGIVRNRLKVNGAVRNARAFLDVQQAEGGFAPYIWSFTEGAPLVRAQPLQAHGETPTHTPESDTLSKALKKRGFTFVGTTICYAFMQSVGMVNDHTERCFRFAELVGADPAGH
jgi:DNA-3-methyladenine glycosylase I